MRISPMLFAMAFALWTPVALAQSSADDEAEADETPTPTRRRPTRRPLDEDAEEAPRPRRRTPPVASDDGEYDADSESLIRRLDSRGRARLRLFDRRIESGKTYRKAGIAMTITGATLAVAGVGILIWGAEGGECSHVGSSCRPVGIPLGSSFLVLSAAAAGIGIPFWLIGHTRVKLNEEQRERLLFAAVPTHNGFAAALAFTF